MSRWGQIRARAFALLLVVGTASNTHAQCPSGCEDVFNGDGIVTVDEIVKAVNNALDSSMCEGATPTPTAATPTFTIGGSITPTATPGITSTPPTSTPTFTIGGSITPTPTPTDDVMSTPTFTPTLDEPGSPALLLGGGGIPNQCRGTCVGGESAGTPCISPGQCRACLGGPNAGQPCTSNVQCPGSTCPTGNVCDRTCHGGAYDGLPCTNPVECNSCSPTDICTKAGTPLACCSGDGVGTCPVVGSCAIVQNPLFAVRVGLNGVCSPRTTPDVACLQDEDCPQGRHCRLSSFGLEGFSNGDGTYSLRIPQESVFLAPSLVLGIGTVCVVAGGDGAGLLDCEGGTVPLDVVASLDHNTTPAFTCIGGSRHGMPCTTAVDCPMGDAECIEGSNTCSGVFAGLPCAENADCPDFGFTSCNNAPGQPTQGNGGGLPDDPECSASFVSPAGTIDYACVEGTRHCAGGARVGKICTTDDHCPESECGGPCNESNVHRGVCNSPTIVELGGSFGAGDMLVSIPLAISILASPAEFGQDGLPCTPDDTTAAPPATVPIILTTGFSRVQIFDAGDSPGAHLGPGATCGSKPCVAQIDGEGVSCDDLLNTGSLSGLVVGGGFPALDTTAGDIVTTFQFVVE